MRNVSTREPLNRFPRNRGSKNVSAWHTIQLDESGHACRTAQSIPSGFASGKQAGLTHSSWGSSVCTTALLVMELQSYQHWPVSLSAEHSCWGCCSETKLHPNCPAEPLCITNKMRMQLITLEMSWIPLGWGKNKINLFVLPKPVLGNRDARTVNDFRTVIQC